MFKRFFFNKNAIVIAVSFCLTNVVFSQIPQINWQKTIGGEWDDVCYDAVKDSFGNFYLAGFSNSEDFYFLNNHDTLSTFTSNDFLLLKINAQGDTVWSTMIGGTDEDFGYGVCIGSDGNILIIGFTYSQDGDVPGNKGNSDVLVSKVDAITGDLIWSKSYGGSSFEESHVGFEIAAVPGDEYVVLASSLSNDGDVHGHNGIPGGDYDLWILKLDINGDTIWTKTIGGTGSEEACAMTSLSDGNVVVAARSNSIDKYIHGGHSAITADYWVVKMNTSNGDTMWTKCLGGSQEEIPYDMIQTSDGNIVIVGSTASNDGDVSGIHGAGSTDFWMVKLDQNTGDTIWTQCLGGSSDEEALRIEETCNGLLISGRSYTTVADGDKSDVSSPGNVSAIWMVKTDEFGNKEWDKTISTSGPPIGQDNGFVVPTIDGRYMVISYTNSDSTGDMIVRSPYNNSYFNSDIWILQLELNIKDQFSFYIDTVCLGDTTHFINTSTTIADEWCWDFGDTTLSTDTTFNTRNSYSAPGTYSVRLITTKYCQKDTVSGSALVYSLPILNLNKDTVIALGDSILLSVNQNANYLWMSSDTLPCDTCQANIVTPIQPTYYTVSVSDTNGCKNKDSVLVSILTEEDIFIFIPNSFSPNGDNKNDEFEIVTSGVKESVLKIFNKWGKLVFETKDLSESWDGRNKKGWPLEEDLYVYLIKGKYLDDKPFTQTGNITLVK